jgi:hypothetical protein
MDIVGGVGDLKNELTRGIHELARAEIQIIDAEIKVLEVLAAMEQLGTVDVDNNGIAFEVSDIFGKDGEFTAEFDQYIKSLKAFADASGENSDLMKSLKSIKFNGKTMYDLLSDGWDEWQKVGFTQESLS